MRVSRRPPLLLLDRPPAAITVLSVLSIRVFLIEVCLSRANNSLCSWSAEPASKRPSGDTYAELLDDLMRMLQDAREWKPVTA